jgi:crotonobetainyl-CoA:carnitine CoA-transferase CaiB-like acyl-CoA transferase
VDPATSREPYLAGLRVVDMTAALSGPYCTKILTDLGAEIISLEPVSGDAMRRRRSPRNGLDYPFQMVHNDKRSLAVDIKDSRGTEIVRRLAGSADVFIQNFRPGVLDRYGLGDDELRKSNPGLIYCSISGYGLTGPMRDHGGVDLIAQGHSGLMSVTGFDAGSPAKAGYPVADLGAGMWAAIGILAALQRRARSGAGESVDVSLTDGLAAWSVWELAEFQMTEQTPEPLGTAHRLTAPYQAFKCHGGQWITVAGIAARWPDLCAVVGRPDLVTDARFRTEADRYANRELLAIILGQEFARDTRDSWIAQLRERNVPVGPVNSMVEVLHDEQLLARDMFREVGIGNGRATVLNTPIKGPGAPGVRSRAPICGEHTREVMLDLGYDEPTINDYVNQGIVAELRKGRRAQ